MSTAQSGGAAQTISLQIQPLQPLEECDVRGNEPRERIVREGKFLNADARVADVESPQLRGQASRNLIVRAVDKHEVADGSKFGGKAAGQ
eukprot:CAMPEP_0183342164 /NCGR_PEP_ID=MMETSP0164_2-20130417/8324_1 /TAXON_ID=221442 /ORGANISM="Coccolithus pelagicus ssp braarudi, Strain PLY182g" /LENGTH=89 /DNA_ID=CAMNT_0025512671 /DNA_START=785 /DNA_END=1055 /DNA_ORIENTATION=+